jgi:protein TonB
MYIDAQFRAAKLPARTPEPRFSGRPLASSLLVHALIAAGLILLAHRTMLREPAETPPIPMMFLPPEPAPVASEPPKAAQSLAPAPPTPAKAEPPPPAPVPQVAPAPPPPVVREVPRPKPIERHFQRRERHERRVIERRVPPPRYERRGPSPEADEPIAPAEPMPYARPAPPMRPAPPVVEAGPFVPPRPLSPAAGNRPPDYPPSLQARGVQGLVLLRVYVTADGRAAAVSVMRSSGSPRLDASALDAVRAWRFIPATRGGRAIPGVAEVPVNFQLSG